MSGARTVGVATRRQPRIGQSPLARVMPGAPLATANPEAERRVDSAHKVAQAMANRFEELAAYMLGVDGTAEALNSVTTALAAAVEERDGR